MNSAVRSSIRALVAPSSTCKFEAVSVQPPCGIGQVRRLPLRVCLPGHASLAAYPARRILGGNPREDGCVFISHTPSVELKWTLVKLIGIETHCATMQTTVRYGFTTTPDYGF